MTTLANVPIHNIRELEDGVWTSGQPTAEQLEQARDAGLASVISLCPDGECGWDERATARALRLEHATVAIAGGGDLTKAAAHALNDALESCPRPVLVHCGSANRAGALLALKSHHVDGHDAETAIEHGRRAGLVELEDTVRRMLRPAQ